MTLALLSVADLGTSAHPSVKLFVRSLVDFCQLSVRFLFQRSRKNIRTHTQEWLGEAKASPARTTSLSAIGAALEAMMATHRMVATLPHPHLLEWLMRTSNEVVVLSEVCPKAFVVCSAY
jgi:hypothetical protein